MNRDKNKGGGPKALEEWARLATDGYRGVSIKNMTTSWRNGMAFCALIHRFHPELIDYDKLDESDILGNCSLAFEVAESKLGIPALLDPQDMYDIEIPDRLSVLTYVAQFYNTLKMKVSMKNSRKSVSPVDMDGNIRSTNSSFEKVGVKRPGSVLNSDDILESTRDNLPKRPVLLSSSAVCSVCENPVFISERVLVSHKLYHRSCFRCSQCNSVLNPQTADIAHNGLLYCLDTNCQKELRFVNRPSSRIDFTKKKAEPVHVMKPHNENVTDSSLPSVKIDNLDSNKNQKVVQDSNRIITNHKTPNGEVVKDKQQESTDGGSQFEKSSSKVILPRSPPNENFVDSIKKTGDDLLTQNRTESSSKKFLRDILEDSHEISPKSSPQILESQKVAEIPKESIKELVEDIPSTDVPSTDSKPLSVPADEDLNDLVDDLLNVEEIVEVQQNEREKVRSVSFSRIVEVSKIESDSGSDVQLLNHDMDTTDRIIDAPKAEPPAVPLNVKPASPETKPKNALQYLKENLETMSSQKNPFEDEEKQSESTQHGQEGDDTTVKKPCHENGEDVLENVSNHESGVGDSLDGDFKRLEGDSLNGSSLFNTSKNDTSAQDMNGHSSLSISSDSLKLRGKGESHEEGPHTLAITPTPTSRRPRVPRSTSPSPRPSPSPRKRASANKLWEKADYYPAELNPFESEDTFTLNQPSDILVVKKASSQVKLVSSNPFEEDDDEEEANISIPPKSPVSSIKSADSVSTSGSVKARSRKNRAPLPPTLTTHSSGFVVHKRPAPPPPVSPNTGVTPVSPEKKKIPASPDLLKGLKTNKGQTTTTTKPRKRRAPPPKRQVTALPEGAIKTELADLAIKEKELERQGINLEETIRRLMAQEDENEEDHIDEMVIQLFNVINEKNEILRRQTELDYLRRGHRLEEMQAEVEFQLRMLMETPIDQRQDNQDEAEQQLLQDLLKIVDERNEVVDWLDFHRQLDREEDLHVSQSLSSFSSLSRSNTPTPTPTQNNLVLPIKSETGPNFKATKSKNKEKSLKEDGKGQKKDKFKIGFFSKKRKSTKSKKQDEDKNHEESLKAS